MIGIPEGVWRHYKGNLYCVLFVARHTETLEEMVVYRDAADAGKVWARPASMWNEEVETGGGRRPRFQYLAPSLAELEPPEGPQAR